MTPIVRTGPAARTGAALLLAGPLVAWMAELITAAAWQQPHYAPLSVGASGARIGLGRGRSIASIALGILGLVSFGVFMADVFSGWMWDIGLFERGVIYPIMTAHVLLGSGLLAAHRTVTARPFPAPR